MMGFMKSIYHVWDFGFEPGIDGSRTKRIDADGSVKVLEDQDAVRQSIMMLLSTRKGERVMHPDYGCDLERIMFMPNDQSTAGLAIHYVRKALEKWEQRIIIDTIDAGADPDETSVLVIQLRYTIKNLNIRDEIEFAISLT